MARGFKVKVNSKNEMACRLYRSGKSVAEASKAANVRPRNLLFALRARGERVEIPAVVSRSGQAAKLVINGKASCGQAAMMFGITVGSVCQALRRRGHDGSQIYRDRIQSRCEAALVKMESGYGMNKACYSSLVTPGAMKRYCRHRGIDLEQIKRRSEMVRAEKIVGVIRSSKTISIAAKRLGYTRSAVYRLAKTYGVQYGQLLKAN
jgi:transposase